MLLPFFILQKCIIYYFLTFIYELLSIIYYFLSVVCFFATIAYNILIFVPLILFCVCKCLFFVCYSEGIVYGLLPVFNLKRRSQSFSTGISIINLTIPDICLDLILTSSKQYLNFIYTFIVIDNPVIPIQWNITKQFFGVFDTGG